jgi:hypothetical protein
VNSNSVVLRPCPTGLRIEGVAYALNVNAIYPGTCISLITGGFPSSPNNTGYDAGQRLPWQPWSIGDNAPGLIAVADVDWLQGKVPTNPQDSGRRFPIYIPMPGDELNMRVAVPAGTTFTPNIQAGTYMNPQIGTGFLVPIPSSGTTGYNTRPFITMENLVPEGVGLQPEFVRVMFTGY